VFTGGFVLSTTNNVGIQGPAYTFDDGAGTTISPTCTADGTAPCFSTVSGTGPLCVSGVGAAVPTNTQADYSTYWGAAVAINVNQAPTTGATTAAYVASAHGVLGFAFDLANTDGNEIRIRFRLHSDPTSNYCATLNIGRNLILYSTVRNNCYTTGGALMTAAQFDDIEAIEWDIPTHFQQTTPFSFCLNNIAAILAGR
jgi:hypothetical protein